MSIVTVPLNPLTLAFKYSWLENSFQRQYATHRAVTHDFNGCLAVLLTQALGLVAFFHVPPKVGKRCLPAYTSCGSLHLTNCCPACCTERCAPTVNLISLICSLVARYGQSPP